LDTVSLIIHVIAAALLVGPQLLLFFAVTPATWLIDDERLRRNVTSVVGMRFGMIAMASLVALLVTGLYQFYSLVPEQITEDMSAYRFGPIFILKMTLFTVLVGLIVFHTFFIGRRVRQLSDAVVSGDGDPAALEGARRTSFVLSFFMVVASVFVLALGVMLGHHDYSWAAN